MSNGGFALAEATGGANPLSGKGFSRTAEGFAAGWFVQVAQRYLREGYDCDLLDLLGVFYHRSHRSLRTL